MNRTLVLDPRLSRSLIDERKRRGLDRQDEVWEGVYVVPAEASLPHQDLVGALTAILRELVVVPGLGRVQPGANVSDRADDWEHNYRVPDVLVVLASGRAVDCTTHWHGGPDVLIEIESPGDDTEVKLPFYGELGVREVLVIQRDSRRLRLYRHDGQGLALIGTSEEIDPFALSSELLPLTFRWKSSQLGPRTELKRKGRKRQTWTV